MHKFTHNFLRKLQNRGRDDTQTVKYRRDKVFMQLAVGGKEVGTIEIKLYYDELPRTCENFRCLCTGEKGIGTKHKKPLHYKGVEFHRLVKGFMMQGGDFSHNNGCGGESIYGLCFDDEGFPYKHTRAGLLSMANSGRNTNGSQFFITLHRCSHLDDIHVVFGEVTKGMDVLRLIEQVEVTSYNNRPKLPVTIVDCGMVRADQDSDDDLPPEVQAQKLEAETNERLAKTAESLNSALAAGFSKRKRKAGEASDSEEETKESAKHTGPPATKKAKTVAKAVLDLGVEFDEGDDDDET